MMKKEIVLNPLKETDEFFTSIFDTGAQGIESFRDGAGLDDLGDFIDEAMDWRGAIEGLGEGFPREARTVTPEQIEAMFEPKHKRLVDAGLHPMLAGSMVTGVKAIYYSYATILQTGQSLMVEPAA